MGQSMPSVSGRIARAMGEKRSAHIFEAGSFGGRIE